MEEPEAPAPSAAVGARAPTKNVDIRRVEVVVNAASGSVGPKAAGELKAILDGYGLEAHIVDSPPEGVTQALRDAVDAAPDLLIVLAGDGTAGLAAQMAGAEGPLLALLPGGTMNMLPHALYGPLPWPDALRAALETGRLRTISGGEVGECRFYCAAILGAPALWAHAREAVRRMLWRRALRRARHALLRAFGGRLRYRIGSGEPRKIRALMFLCPLISRRLTSEAALEVAAFDPKGAAEVVRIGLTSLISDWRNDPKVEVETCVEATAWTKGAIPALLDGESHRLHSPATIRFIPAAFRALATQPLETPGLTPSDIGAALGQADAPPR